jgi:hypothetical protein
VLAGGLLYAVLLPEASAFDDRSRGVHLAGNSAGNPFYRRENHAKYAMARKWSLKKKS